MPKEESKGMSHGSEHGSSVAMFANIGSLCGANQSAPESINREIFRNAIIKGYELSQETSFKLLRKALREFGHSVRKLDALPVKEIMRLSATHGLMTLGEVERWFLYRDNHNDTAHEYSERFANETMKLLPDFIADGKRLESVLRERLGHGRT